MILNLNFLFGIGDWDRGLGIGLATVLGLIGCWLFGSFGPYSLFLRTDPDRVALSPEKLVAKCVLLYLLYISTGMWDS